MGEQNKAPIDPLIATMLGAVFGVLGVFGIFAQLEIGADDVAMLTGFIGAGLTAARTMWLRRKARLDG